MLAIVRIQVATSWKLAKQYRLQWMADALLALAWVLIGIIPLKVAMQHASLVSGWTLGQALIVLGVFTMLKGVIDAAIHPSLLSLVEDVRTGRFDFILLKPVDAQWLTSMKRVQVFKLVDVLYGAGLVVYAVQQERLSVSAANFLLGALTFGCSVLCAYAIWTMAASLAFWFVRVENLTYVLQSFIDFGRWPVDVFQGFWRWLFVWVVPLGIMTTMPARALAGSLEPAAAIRSALVAALLLLISRTVWRRALAAYTSAST